MKPENLKILGKSALMAAVTAIGASIGGDAPLLIGFVLFFLMYLVLLLLGFPWFNKQKRTQTEVVTPDEWNEYQKAHSQRRTELTKPTIESKNVPRTMLDDVREVGNRLIVKGYRRIAAQNGGAPTQKTSDAKIVDVYEKVGQAFHEGEIARNENISTSNLNFIVLCFLAVYENDGEQKFKQYLRHEVMNYTAKGLRDKYKIELQLFDLQSNEHDITLMKTLQSEAAEQLSRRGQSFDIHMKQPDAYSFNAFSVAINKMSLEIISSSKAATMQVTDVIKKGATKNHQFSERALSNEISAYHIRVAINAIMRNQKIHGREQYENTQKFIRSGLALAIHEMVNNHLNIRLFFEITSDNVFNLAHCYFTGNNSYLEVSQQDIEQYSRKFNAKILDILPTQIALACYVIRIARITNVEKIDYSEGMAKFIMLGVTNNLLDRSQELEAKAQEIMSQCALFGN